MKIFGSLLTALLLTGCATTNYQELVDSSGSISNLSIKEIKKSKHGASKLGVKFNYEINKFNQGSNIYHCSVQFLTVDEGTTTTYLEKRDPCRIDKPSGEVSIRWSTPLDKNLYGSEKKLSNIKFPVQYFVALHQKTGRYTSRIIGKTALQTLEIE